MDPALTAQLTALGAVIIGALGTLVTLLVERIKRDLAKNTLITTEARDAADGHLAGALTQLAAERNRSLGLRAIIRERDDRLAYIQSRIPEVDRVLTGYRERRQTRTTESQELKTLQRLLDEPDDPTGSDAGAHPGG
jgi:hypothetical protein